jgi:hypothetical protein
MLRLLAIGERFLLAQELEQAVALGAQLREFLLELGAVLEQLEQPLVDLFLLPDLDIEADLGLGARTGAGVSRWVRFVRGWPRSSSSRKTKGAAPGADSRKL